MADARATCFVRPHLRRKLLLTVTIILKQQCDVCALVKAASKQVVTGAAKLVNYLRMSCCLWHGWWSGRGRVRALTRPCKGEDVMWQAQAHPAV